MSNSSAVLIFGAPNNGGGNDHDVTSSNGLPASNGAAAVVAASNNPTPSTVHGRNRDSDRTSAIPPAMYRSAIAEPASRPPTNPPPGWLWPANSSHNDPTRIA